MTDERLIELARGAEPLPGEAQELARDIIDSRGGLTHHIGGTTTVGQAAERCYPESAVRVRAPETLNDLRLMFDKLER